MMRKTGLFYLFLTIIPLIVSCTEKQSLPDILPVEDFFKNPETIKYSLSPDGKYISFLKDWNNRLNIYVKTTLGDDTLRITNEKDKDIEDFVWVNDEKIVYFVDKKGTEEYSLYSIDISGKNEKLLHSAKKAKIKVISLLSNIENEILILENSRDNKIFDVYRLNIETGKMKMVLKNPGNYTEFLPDHNGVIRIVIATDGVREAILHREDDNSEFTTLKITNFKNVFYPRRFTPDNKNLYVLSNINRDKKVLIEYDIDKNEEVRVIFEHPFVDLEDVVYSTKRKDVVGVRYSTWKKETVYFDEEIKYFAKELRKRFPGYITEIASIDKNENFIVIKVHNDKTRGIYYLYDTNEGEFSKLAEVCPWLQEENMADMNPVSYLADDDKNINGYLVLPKNTKPHKLPVIVIVHGGLWNRVHWNFNAAAQLFANRGYAVFMMNFRGSTGYGKEFWTSGFKQWGQKMQDDVTSGVEWLIDQKIADPDRIAIMGDSYGGYSAMMGLIINPDLYSCGISISGMTDLIHFLESVPPYWEPFRKMLAEMIGDPYKDKEMLKENSPVYNIKSIKSPLFLAYGANDSKIDLLDVKKIYSFLKDRRIPVEKMIKENEAHGFKNQENRIELYSRIEKFVETHLGRAR